MSCIFNKTLIQFLVVLFIFSTSCRTGPCENRLCGNGVCDNGECQCDDFYEGENCEEEVRKKLLGNYTGITKCQQTQDLDIIKFELGVPLGSPLFFTNMQEGASITVKNLDGSLITLGNTTMDTTVIEIYTITSTDSTVTILDTIVNTLNNTSIVTDDFIIVEKINAATFHIISNSENLLSIVLLRIDEIELYLGDVLIDPNEFDAENRLYIADRTHSLDLENNLVIAYESITIEASALGINKLDGLGVVWTLSDNSNFNIELQDFSTGGEDYLIEGNGSFIRDSLWIDYILTSQFKGTLNCSFQGHK